MAELRTGMVIISSLHIMLTLYIRVTQSDHRIKLGDGDGVVLPSFSGRGHNVSIVTTQTGSSPQG